MHLDTLVALAEPNRLRIVELLGAQPRAVGEIAATLDLRQPQVTKHLQTLQRAGLVTMHPLGQRRVYALERAPLRALREALAPFAEDHPSEDVLEQYRRAIDAERERPDPEAPRTLRFTRDLPAAPAVVWEHWTTAAAVRRWWSPRHFRVADCDVEPVVDGALRVVLQEGDGTRHEATGRFLALRPHSRLRFAMAPIDAAGAPLFAATHDVRLARSGSGTRLTMDVRVTDARPEAAPALAGMRPGWEQTLDRLAEVLAGADAG